MLDFLSSVHLVTAEVAAAGDGVSTESILVFAGGLIAAATAVASALLTSRAAATRLEASLTSERERAEKQLDAERKRIDRQLEHERFLAQRAEASASIESVARLFAKTADRISTHVRKVSVGQSGSASELEELHSQLRELLEEINVVGIRFGTKNSVVRAMLGVTRALNKAIPAKDDLPLSEAQKAESKEALKRASRANVAFLESARDALENYSEAWPLEDPVKAGG